jgi:hypothetical protein
MIAARLPITRANTSTSAAILRISSKALRILAHTSTASLPTPAVLPAEPAVGIIRLQAQALPAATSLSGPTLVPTFAAIVIIVADDGAGAAALLVR